MIRLSLFSWLSQVFRWILDNHAASRLLPANVPIYRPKIAIIGTGVTRIAAASQCAGFGFDVTIFEAGSRDTLGGIWSVAIRNKPKHNLQVADFLVASE